jgi:tRNA dimethylallyltransferase
MNTLIVILGPTGIGKTDLGISIANKLETEIISCDSRQFYKELKIGTAMPNEEQLLTIKHHFIGHLSIYDYYNASMFEIDVLKLLEERFQKKKKMIMLGGSGMYIDVVCRGIDDLPDIDQEIRNQLQEKFEKEGIESLRFELKRLDPEYYSIVDLKNPKRILKGLEICMMTGKTYTSFRTSVKKERDFKILKIGLNTNREKLYKRINSRVDKMVEAGLVDEAREFYPLKNINALKTVGYKELFDHFDGLYDLDKAIELIKRNSRHYAKRQLTWFARDKEITWFEPTDEEGIIEFIYSNLNGTLNLEP